MRWYKRLFLVLGCTSIMTAAGLAVVFGLLLSGWLLSAFSGQPDPATGPDDQHRFSFVTRPPPATPASVPTGVASGHVPQAATGQPSPTTQQASISAVPTEPSPPATAPPTEPAPVVVPATVEQMAPTTDTALPAIQDPAATSPAVAPLNASAVTISSPTKIPTATARPTGTPVATARPTETPAPTATAVHPDPATATLTPPPTPVPGQITGRVLVAGAPATGITLQLEDQNFTIVAQTLVGADGSFTFSNLAESGPGYTLLFAQEWNSQYSSNQVISWAWLGTVPVADGEVVQLPDLDLALQGFGHTNPAPNTTFSAADVSAGNPIVFEWAAYPQAATYWLDLVQEGEQTPLWTASTQTTQLSFDGTLDSGGKIKPGEYWWGVGAERKLGNYTLVVYGYLPVLVIEP